MQSILRPISSSLVKATRARAGPTPRAIIHRSCVPSLTRRLAYSTQPPPPSASVKETPDNQTAEPENQLEAPPKKTAIGRINRRLQITFTCTADITPVPEDDAVPASVVIDELKKLHGAVEAASPEIITCGHRSTHEFSRVSYEKGIVLIECPGCKNRHLIADNLSWFADTPSPAHPSGLPLNTPKYHRTVEDLMKEKGEKVKWLQGKNDAGGIWTLEG